MADIPAQDQDVTTYSLITAEQILEKYPLYLGSEAIMAVLRHAGCVYHLLLDVPLRMLLNGIIIQQAHDYQVYVQKLYVDYLLSGEAGKDESAPGAFTREDLETERTRMVGVSHAFQALERTHTRSLEQAQEALSVVARAWREAVENSARDTMPLLEKAQIAMTRPSWFRVLMDAFAEVDGPLKPDTEAFWKVVDTRLGKISPRDWREALIRLCPDVKPFVKLVHECAMPWDAQARDIGQQARAYRVDFYESILKVTELLKQLPDYRKDEERDTENRELLYFDAHLGDSQK